MASTRSDHRVRIPKQHSVSWFQKRWLRAEAARSLRREKCTRRDITRRRVHSKTGTEHIRSRPEPPRRTRTTRRHTRRRRRRAWQRCHRWDRMGASPHETRTLSPRCSNPPCEWTIWLGIVRRPRNGYRLRRRAAARRTRGTSAKKRRERLYPRALTRQSCEYLATSRSRKLQCASKYSKQQPRSTFSAPSPRRRSRKRGGNTRWRSRERRPPI